VRLTRCSSRLSKLNSSIKWPCSSRLLKISEILGLLPSTNNEYKSVSFIHNIILKYKRNNLLSCLHPNRHSFWVALNKFWAEEMGIDWSNHYKVRKNRNVRALDDYGKGHKRA
jgi:hypothetical protein